MIPFIGYYTANTPYEDEAAGLLKSAEGLHLDVRLYPVEGRGSWEANCQIKAEVILRAAQELNTPFVYLDVDARFSAVPELFDCSWEKEYDLGVHYFRGVELLSGTIYVNPTVETIGLLAEWIRENQENPVAWDQRTLYKVIRQSPRLRVLKLPPEYCFIFDLSRRHYGNLAPAIIHYQASRRLKRVESVSLSA